MDKATFENLTEAEVAGLVRSAGRKVCVFPINGTRRWFMLEHAGESATDSARSYLDAASRRHIELYQLLFDHGVDTLLTPIFGPDLLDRGEAYVRMAVEGMTRLGTHPDFLTFYQEYGVRVRFYGDYERHLDPAAAERLSTAFNGATKHTLGNDQHRLFFGVFAHDAVETVAALSAEFYAQHGQPPDKRTLVELYYGEYVPPVDFFIGFDKFSVFDMPLVSTGEEDLYFTVVPSPYLTTQQLRSILYDHIYTRPEGERDYSELSPRDQSAMRDFYQANLGKTQGVGARHDQAGFWYPLPQVELPESLENAS